MRSALCLLGAALAATLAFPGRAKTQDCGCGVDVDQFPIVVCPECVTPRHTITRSDGSPVQIDLICPPDPIQRIQWSALITNELCQMGFKAYLHVPTWDIVSSRTSSITGPTYSHGGFDAFFISWYEFAAFDPTDFLSTSAPFAFNYGFYDSGESDLLINQYFSTPSPQGRQTALSLWQKRVHEDEPKAPIFYPKQIFYVANSLSGFDPATSTARAGTWTGPSSVTYLAPSVAQDLNPLTGQDYGDLVVWSTLFEPLATREPLPGQKLVPALADSWTSSPDSKTWTIHLCSAQWSDGVPFMAEDVKFSLECDALIGLTTALGPNPGAQIQALNETRTVIVQLPQPYALFDELVMTLPIVPKHKLATLPPRERGSPKFGPGTFTAWGKGGFSRNPVGTGPYADPQPILDSTGNLLGWTVTANPRYRGAAPAVQTITFRTPDSNDAAVAEMLAGTAQVIDSPDINAGAVPSSIAQQIPFVVFGRQELGFNFHHPDLATKEVRQAISHLIDRQRIVNEIVGGLGQVGVTPVSPSQTVGGGLSAFDTTIAPYAFDEAAAIELLRSAGYIVTP
jgi:ABC-type transport system substrate-binding protein